MRWHDNYKGASADGRGSVGESGVGAGGPKFRKNLTVPKNAAQCRKLTHSAENTLFLVLLHRAEL